MMHYGTGLGSMFFPGFGLFIQFIFLIFIVIIVYWLIKSGNIHSSNSSGNAKEILDKRLANGDIDINEYKKLKREIDRK